MTWLSGPSTRREYQREWDAEVEGVRHEQAVKNIHLSATPTCRLPDGRPIDPIQLNFSDELDRTCPALLSTPNKTKLKAYKHHTWGDDWNPQDL